MSQNLLILNFLIEHPKVDVYCLVLKKELRVYAAMQLTCIAVL